jgi:hypothetical protein
VDRAVTSQLGPAGSLVASSRLTLSAAGGDEIKASVNLQPVGSGSATWRVTRLSGRLIRLTLVRSTGVPQSFLSSVHNIPIPIPKLPLGVTIGSVRITPTGVVGHISGRNLTFGS